MHTHQHRVLQGAILVTFTGVLLWQLGIVLQQDFKSIGDHEIVLQYLAQASGGGPVAPSPSPPPEPSPPPPDPSPPPPDPSPPSPSPSPTADPPRHHLRTWPEDSGTSAASVGSSSVSSPPPETCGDGFLDPGEECDLGELKNGTRTCSVRCTIFYCGDEIVSPQVGEKCEPPQKDVTYFDEEKNEFYVVREFAEQTGNRRCVLPDEKGFGGCVWKFFTGIPSRSSSSESAQHSGQNAALSSSSASGAPRLTKCGNGTQEVGEECDQGEKNSDFLPDACRSICILPRCGDGVRDTAAGESCDLGEANSDTASNACRTNCTLARCGDGITDSNEECDGGSLCSAQCHWRVPTRDVTPAPQSICGNGSLDEQEECDDGNTQDGDGCAHTCLRETSTCGNGIINPGEECDDGNLYDGDQCSRFCYRELHRCGNGVVDPGEECDDGFRNSDTMPDACRMSCMKAHCGDRMIDSREECDDGNTNNVDACTTTCRIQSCGDGIVQALEECDDGNMVSQDGCSDECRSETQHAASLAEGGPSLPVILFLSFIVIFAGVATGLRWVL